VERRNAGRTERRRKCLLIRLVWGSAIVWHPCTVAVADGEKKLLVFLKAQESCVRGDSGEKRGEEAVRAATQLSDFSSQTEKRHLRHMYDNKKAGLLFCHFGLFPLLYSTWGEFIPLVLHCFITG